MLQLPCIQRHIYIHASSIERSYLYGKEMDYVNIMLCLYSALFKLTAVIVGLLNTRISQLAGGESTISLRIFTN